MSGITRKLWLESKTRTIYMWPVVVFFLVGLHCVKLTPISREGETSNQERNTTNILENVIPNDVQSKPDNNESDKRKITENSTSQYVDSETDRQERAKRQIIENNVPNYLMNFGYLPEEDAQSGLLMSDDVLKKALMDMQSFAHLPVTGKMDKATTQLMHTPRCGLPDKGANTARSKRYALQGAKWDLKKPLTWSLRGRNTGNVDRERVRRTVHDALEVWQKNSRLKFRETRDDDDADILVSFARREHGDSKGFDGPGMVLAHAYFPGGGIGGDAHFDEDETWKVEEGREGTSLFAVAVHEFGHSLGLLHSDKKEAIMYPWLITTMHLSKLPDDDRIAIQEIYGANLESTFTNVDRKTQEYPQNPWRIPRPPSTTPRVRTIPPYTRYPETRYPETTRSWYGLTTRSKEPFRWTTPYKKRYGYEDVATRPPKTHHHPKETPPEHKSPETCVHDFDAIFMYRGELYIFKDVYVWRFRNSMIQDGFPTKITHFWDALPKDIKRIDAAYENPLGEVVFFSGRHFYVVRVADRMTLTRSGRLSDLGLPGWLDNIDGAMVFPGDGTTYFFAGEVFWQFDEATGRASVKPKQIATGWKGVQKDVDAVVPWSDGKTYFFKDKGYWKYGAEKVGSMQELSAPLLMMCTGATGTHFRGLECNFEENEIC